jgi:uncharacterized membrane protein YdbT with pleckstrin-like domain
VLLGTLVVRACTRYTIQQRRTDVSRGVFVRRRFSVWTCEVTEVALTRSLLQQMFGVCTIRLRLSQKKDEVKVPSVAPFAEMERPRHASTGFPVGSTAGTELQQ